ncbi:hypothetical protein NN6n1_12940 [Shinella zoogloeoides]
MSTETPKTQFIIIHETPLQSWLRDASSFMLFACLIGLGVVVGSTAMQWAGFFVAVIILLGRAGSMKARRMSRAEAISYLQDGEQA